MTLRWGIVGPGTIARTVASEMALVGHQVVAVQGRDNDRARRFLAEIGKAADPEALVVAEVETLASVAGVDAVYIATPHPAHFAAARRLLKLGLPVLVEKPATLSEAESETLVELAQRRGVFFMEAMWTRCLPVIRAAADLAPELGGPQLLQADFSFASTFDPTSRLYDPALGGGAVYDVGVYVLHLADLFFGRSPDRLVGTHLKAPSGVDALTSISATWDGQGVAALTCGLCVGPREDARLTGPRGHLHLPGFWHTHQGEAVIDGQTQALLDPTPGRGYLAMLLEVERCLDEDRIESPFVPHAATVRVAKAMEMALR